MESTVKCISFDFMAARTTRHLMDGDFFLPDSDRTVSHISQTALKEFYVYVFFFLALVKLDTFGRRPRRQTRS
jgi:hypothetical protein